MFHFSCLFEICLETRFPRENKPCRSVPRSRRLHDTARTPRTHASCATPALTVTRKIQILAPRAGLEDRNSEAFQGEVWRGRGFWDVGNHKDFIAFWHPPGIGLWAPGHQHFGYGHLCPSMDLHPSKTNGLHMFFMVSGNAPRAPEPARSVNSRPCFQRDVIKVFLFFIISFSFYSK